MHDEDEPTLQDKLDHEANEADMNLYEDREWRGRMYGDMLRDTILSGYLKTIQGIDYD